MSADSAAAAPPPGEVPSPGELIAGKYRVEKVVGVGGMGTVLAAHHEILDQRVAVKVLFAQFAKKEEFVHRFLLEARAAARLRSEHVARVMDAGTLENGLPFIVMEFLDGCDLDEMLHCNGALPAIDVVDYALQALEALAQAHGAGIVHRDLKPSNLFLSLKADGTHIVKVLDFGISKVASEASMSGDAMRIVTGEGKMLGSPGYMSPEQVRSAKSVDERTDIWSLGVIMYELLSGGPLFDLPHLSELLLAIIEKEPAPLRSKSPKVPAGLAAVIEKCLKKDRNARYIDVADLARALKPYASAHCAPLADAINKTLSFAVSVDKARSGRASMPDIFGAESPSGKRARQTDLANQATMDAPPPASGRRVSAGSDTVPVVTGTGDALAAGLPNQRRMHVLLALAGVLLFGGGLFAIASHRSKEPFVADTVVAPPHRDTIPPPAPLPAAPSLATAPEPSSAASASGAVSVATASGASMASGAPIASSPRAVTTIASPPPSSHAVATPPPLPRGSSAPPLAPKPAAQAPSAVPANVLDSPE